MRKKTNNFLVKASALLFFFTLLVGNSSSAHKFYMSITDMEYNPSTRSLQISMKLFVNDLEMVLEKEQKARILLGTKKEHPETDNFISAYVNTHFIVEQSKGSLPVTFIGKEVDKDYAWIYLEVKKFKVKDETLLTNSTFLDYFPDQSNKINFKNGAEVVSFTLYKQNASNQF